MLERIKAFFASLFARFQKKPEAAIPHPTEKPPEVVKPLSIEEWLASLPPSTRAFIPQGREREYRDSLIAAQNASGPVNRSGNDLSDGAPRTFVLSNGQPQTVTFNRGGIVRVIGSNGSQIRSLADFETRALAGTIAGYERTYADAGSYTFSVVFQADSGSGEVAVTLR